MMLEKTQRADGSGAMFDAIAERYDLLNRLMSFGVDRRWRRITVDSLAPALGGAQQRRVLDLATGTGDLALAIARRYPHAEVVGVDPSIGMLRIAREKASDSSRVRFETGDAQALELEDDSFDAATIAFGIRNVPDRSRGLSELARVVRPGGIVAVLELGEPESGLLAPFARFHVHHVVPRLGALLSGKRQYRYLQESVAAFPQPTAFQRLMEDAGLVTTKLRSFAFGACHLFLSEVPS